MIYSEVCPTATRFLGEQHGPSWQAVFGFHDEQTNFEIERPPSRSSTTMIPNDGSPWANDIEFITPRFLQQNETASSETIVTADGNTTQILRNSLRIYGSLFACGFIVYCYFRKRIPRTFAVRQWIPEHKTPLAQDQFGHISWIWKVYSFSEEQLVETIGFDALCFLRLLNLGFRLSCIGVFNSIWLFPVYTTTSNSDGDDPVKGSTINILPDGSPRFAATVVAAYIFFGYTMYSIQKDFLWFIKKRHAWLKRFNVRNYTILIRNIPEELRSDQLLKAHFQGLYGRDRVLEAHVCLHISHLLSLEKKRKVCVRNLEHALAEEKVHGKRPTKTLSSQEKEMLVDGTGGAAKGRRFKVDAIDLYENELTDLNEQIDKQIKLIEKKSRPKLTPSKGKSAGMQDSSVGSRRSSADGCEQDDEENDYSRHGEMINGVESLDEDEALHQGSVEERGEGKKVAFIPGTKDASHKGIVRRFASKSTSTLQAAASVAKTKAIRLTTKRIKQAQGTVSTATEAVSSVLVKEADGTADDAGFVTFTSLVATHCALQMSQHHEPFTLETVAAPDEPSHIFWGNVGKNKEVLQTGFLMSTAVTIAICLFWTFIVSFIVNLTNVEYLNTTFPRTDEVLTNNPWVGQILSFLSPMLLLIFNSGLLPIVLKTVSRLECPASDSLLEASAFWKMATFTIIQTFYVSLISGSILQQLEALLNNPNEIIGLLARALPGRSGYFMQLLIVSTCIGTLVELFRVIPLMQSVFRANLGRRLTVKERNRAVGLLRPLSNVDKIYFSRLQSRYLLYFMVMFVYTTISPLVNWFCMVLFLFCGSVYRYQFVFNYPSTPDSGGTVWLYFMRVILICIIIAQVTIFGFLSLKESAIGAIFMVILIGVTLIFIVYLNQSHFKIGKYLPAKACLSQDMANEDDGVEYEDFEDMYKSPALLAPYLDADRNVVLHGPSRLFSASSNGDKDVAREADGFDGFEVEEEDVASERPRVPDDTENGAPVDNGKNENAESFLHYVTRVLAIK